MDIQIKNLETVDKDIFEQLYSDVIKTEFKEYSKKTCDYFTGEAYTKRMWNLPIKLGIFVDEKLVGFVLSENPFGGVAFVHWIGIARNFQGKGLGKQLLGLLQELLLKKGAHAIHLQAAQKNIPFYEKCGYEVYGVDTKGYYGAKDYHLRRLLQEPVEQKFFD